MDSASSTENHPQVNTSTFDNGLRMQGGFPYNPKAVLTPPTATVSDYRALQKKLGTSRNVMVQPSTYGTDNTCVLDVLTQLGENCRAVCVVNSKVTDAELKKLNAAGVRGVRVQFGLGNPVSAEEVMPWPSASPMGWHIQCNMPPEQLVQMESCCQPAGAGDHRPSGPGGGRKGPQYVTVRKLLDPGHGWVKVSGAYLYGGGPRPIMPAPASGRVISRRRRNAVSGAATGRIRRHKKLNPVAMPDDVTLLNFWRNGRRMQSCVIAFWWKPGNLLRFDPEKPKF